MPWVVTEFVKHPEPGFQLSRSSLCPSDTRLQSTRPAPEARAQTEHLNGSRGSRPRRSQTDARAR